MKKPNVFDAYKHLKPIVFFGDKAALLRHFQLKVDEGTLSAEKFA